MKPCLNIYCHLLAAYKCKGVKHLYKNFVAAFPPSVHFRSITHKHRDSHRFISSVVLKWKDKLMMTLCERNRREWMWISAATSQSVTLPGHTCQVGQHIVKLSVCDFSKCGEFWENNDRTAIISSTPWKTENRKNDDFIIYISFGILPVQQILM